MLTAARSVLKPVIPQIPSTARTTTTSPVSTLYRFRTMLVDAMRPMGWVEVVERMRMEEE